ncbi:baseplate J/gp47 family protein [Acaryochloris sp. IP29b_bin.148]|uniref:baseplate J/gp47 family protein n=1 Tax=Acaryochloris sp. IP29b_bin.148 TaxID=2969218 RepID=UPI0026028374|nr:baseplate J/gp47 family protein [Acaryochloris sp. IP29b_bin.148]
MELKAQGLRDGTSQRNRSLRSLDPDYVSIDEQTLADWIRFAQAYAKKLTYFNEHNQLDGDWSAFFAMDVEAIAAALQILDTKDAIQATERGNTSSFPSPLPPKLLQTLSQPQLTLFLTFLRLLRYPQQQFKALTQRRLDFYYRQVLQLAEKAAIPDRTHVIFTLAPDQTDAVLAKGTRLSAGVDQQGNGLEYEVDTDLYITQAQVASVKTLAVEKVYIDLKYIHLADNRSDTAFAKMLRWAVGTPSQGGSLPSPPATDPLTTQAHRTDQTTFSEIVALFQVVKDLTLQNIDQSRQYYIMDQLCFATLEDFKFCFDVHARENTKHLPDITPPTEAEWEQVYQRVERAYRKKINRDRRTRLKQEHLNDQYLDAAAAFMGLWQLALGDPASGNPLPPFLQAPLVDLNTLLTALNEGDDIEAANRYVQDQLFLSVADFRKIMGIQMAYRRQANAQASGSPNNSASLLMTDQEEAQWAEVYRLLEQAQTRKRKFTYPPIGRTELKKVWAQAIADTKPGQSLTLPRFHPLIVQAPSASQASKYTGVQSLGIAIASPVLAMSEGHREITLTLACQADTFNRGLLEDLLQQGDRPFAVAISSATGWLSISQHQLTFQVGDFFLEPPLTSYGQADVEVMYQGSENTFAASHVGQYLQFPDGWLYRINTVEGTTSASLSPVGRIASGDAIHQYPNLDLGGGGIILNNLELSRASDGHQEMRATDRPSQDAFRFKRSDVGSFIVWSDGVIYEITQFGGTTRVGVQLWGYLPASGQIQKHDRIALNAAPTARLAKLTPTQVKFRENALFEPKDIGTLITGVTGAIYKLEGLVDNRAATVTAIGRISRSPIPNTQFEQYSATGIYLNGLQFKFSLDTTQPAITAPTVQAPISNFQTAHPIITITLEDLQQQQGQSSSYQLFKDFCLEKANVQVTVRDIQALQLRNDRTVLNPKSPFEPFDIQPIAGASLYFSHPEIVMKKLDTLSLKLEWMGLPDSFAAHYYAYYRCGLSPRPPVINDDSFQVQLDLWLNRTWHTIGKQVLFSIGQNTTKLSPISTLQYTKAQFVGLPAATFKVIPTAPDIDDVWEQNRYFRLELARPDFQHTLYPLVLNKVARAQDTDFVKDEEGNDTETKIQNLSVFPPYTPKIKGISLNYQASAEINLRAGDQANQEAAGTLFQLHPFGYVDLQQTATPGDAASRYFLLPQYKTEGSLFIGLCDVKPSQALTLLFQLVSGSGNADLTPPDIQWSYLAGDRWHPFQPAEVLSDSTNGLVDSGIVHLDIPATATANNHLLPAGLHWLRATVDKHAAAIPDTLAIRTQAVTATFVDQQNDPEHLSQPLAAQSIQSLTEENAAIATVEQPYSSFGGRRQESHRTFYTRVSEQLRHKRRAITRWDYERLVLEQFPQIYKVKCLTQAEQANAPNAAQVTVVVIPNLANTAPFLPLEPKAPQYLLQAIAAYLQAHSSPFVKVAVKNPRYEQIKYRIGVRFRESYEQGYYLKQLNEELVRFLSPWAYEAQSDISFGSSIHSSAVIHFIETRPYVDYVTNLKLIEQVTLANDGSLEADTPYRVSNTNLAQVTQVDSILVSAPEHIIDLIATADYEEETFEGIDYMIIGVDFVVT